MGGLWCQRLAPAGVPPLTLNLLTTTVVAPPSNASKWQMGFNLSFKGLKRPGIHYTGGLVGPRAGLHGCGKSRSPPGFDPRTVQPVASRYTGSPVGRIGNYTE
jgi:hypothetical protein